MKNLIDSDQTIFTTNMEPDKIGLLTQAAQGKAKQGKT